MHRILCAMIPYLQQAVAKYKQCKNTAGGDIARELTRSPRIICISMETHALFKHEVKKGRARRIMEDRVRERQGRRRERIGRGKTEKSDDATKYCSRLHTPMSAKGIYMHDAHNARVRERNNANKRLARDVATVKGYSHARVNPIANLGCYTRSRDISDGVDRCACAEEEIWRSIVNFHFDCITWVFSMSGCCCRHDRFSRLVIFCPF